MLAVAARSCSLPKAQVWAKSTGIVADSLMAWMPNLAYPVRHGVDSNTAGTKWQRLPRQRCAKPI